MTLPPFFYKNASDDGIYAYFARLIETVDSPNLQICLYHIPPMAGMGFSPELAGRLAGNFPDIVVAYKDSSGDFDNTRAVIDAAPDIAVFPGSETFLVPGLENGGKGCISATCNINPRGIRRVFDIATGGYRRRSGYCNRGDAQGAAVGGRLCPDSCHEGIAGTGAKRGKVGECTTTVATCLGPRMPRRWSSRCNPVRRACWISCDRVPVSRRCRLPSAGLPPGRGRGVLRYNEASGETARGKRYRSGDDAGDLKTPAGNA